MARTGTDPQVVIAVKIPPELKQRIDRAARLDGKHMAEHVRDLLNMLHPTNPPPPPPPPIKRRPPWAEPRRG